MVGRSGSANNETVDLEHLAEDLRLDVEDIVNATTVLYTLLAKYTSGTVKQNSTCQGKGDI